MASIKVSRLNLVDLAGSERQKDTHAEGLRLKVHVNFTYFSVKKSFFKKWDRCIVAHCLKECRFRTGLSLSFESPTASVLTPITNLLLCG